MMGSRVHAGDVPLAAALASTDDHSVSVRQALRDAGQAGALTPAPRGWAWWLEPHIDQGPVMEATNTDIGVECAEREIGPGVGHVSALPPAGQTLAATAQRIDEAALD
jgi:hypothetical protein